MVATIATFSSILKEFYLGPIQEQLNNEVLVLDIMTKMSVDWNGRLAHIPVHLDRNTGVQYVAEGTTFVAAGLAAGDQTYANYTVNAAFLYGRFEVTGPAIASAGQGGKNTFIGWMDAEMDKLVTDVKNEADRSCFSGGRFVGFLNQHRDVVAGAAGTTWDFTGDILKLQELCDLPAANTLDVVFIRHDVGNAAAWAYLNNAAAAAVTPAAPETLTLAGIDVAAGTIVLPAGLITDVVDDGFAIGVYVVDDDANVEAVVGDISVGQETQPTGIYGNLGGTIQGLAAAQPRVHFGVDVAVNTALQSNIMTNADGGAQNRAPLALPRLQQVFDQVLSQSDKEPDCIIMHPMMRQQYVALMTLTMQTLTNKAEQGDVGFTGFSYGGVPIKTARHCARGAVIFLQTKNWKMLQLQSGGFADLDGNVLSRVTAADSWEGFYRWYYNTICMRPNAQAILVGIDL